MTYDFDKPIDRTGTCDVKHARLAEMWHRTDLIPLWVADMDWQTPPFIAEALTHRVQNALYGYTALPGITGIPSSAGCRSTMGGR